MKEPEREYVEVRSRNALTLVDCIVHSREYMGQRAFVLEDVQYAVAAIGARIESRALLTYRREYPIGDRTPQT